MFTPDTNCDLFFKIIKLEIYELNRTQFFFPTIFRAVKLTYVGTREKILKALQDVKDEAFKFDSTKELELIEEQATHDYLIKKFKNYKAASKWDEDWCPDDKNYKSGPGRPSKEPKEPGARGPRGPYKKTQNRGGLSSSIMSGAMNRACTPKCPGSYGILPSLQCVGCKAMFHAKCQGMYFNLFSLILVYFFWLYSYKISKTCL